MQSEHSVAGSHSPSHFPRRAVCPGGFSLTTLVNTARLECPSYFHFPYGAHCAWESPSLPVSLLSIYMVGASHLRDSSLFIAHIKDAYPGSSRPCEHIVPGILQPLLSPRWGLCCENLQLHIIPVITAYPTVPSYPVAPLKGICIGDSSPGK